MNEIPININVCMLSEGHQIFIFRKDKQIDNFYTRKLYLLIQLKYMYLNEWMRERLSR